MLHRKEIQAAYDSIGPSAAQKERMLSNIFSAAAQEDPRQKHPPVRSIRKKVLLVAAVAALTVLLVGCAAVLFRMEDMKIGEYTPDHAAEETGAVRSVLSLQGFVGSKNYLANQEWFEFSSQYDFPDEEELPLEARINYLAYGAFFQDQIDKIDEICQKYDLTTLGHEWMEADAQTVFDALGIDGILADQPQANVTLHPGYYYSNGTFQMDGRLTLLDPSLQWPQEISFSLRCSMKESLDTVCAHIRQIDSYQQWNYTTADGTQLLMALSPYHGMMFADFDDHFVTISIQNVLSGDQAMISRAVFEAMADVFDLSFQPHRVDEEAAELRQEAQAEALQAEREKNKELYAQQIGKASYDARVRVLLENGSAQEQMGYAFRDLDQDGEPELLIGLDGNFTAIYTDKEGETHSFVPSDGTSLYHLCENNVIASISHSAAQDGMQKNYWFVTLNGTHPLCLDSLSYRPWEAEGQRWTRTQVTTADGTVCEAFDPYDVSLKQTQIPITEAEAQAILAGYTRICQETAPLAEYPLSEPAAAPSPSAAGWEVYSSYGEKVTDLLENEYQGEQYQYALFDMDENGIKELFLAQDDTITQLYTLSKGKVRRLDHGINTIRPLREGMFEECHTYPSGIVTYFYYQVTEEEQVLQEYLRYDEARNPGNPWLRSTDGTPLDRGLEEITQEEFDRIRNSYEQADLTLAPITEYPLNEP